MNQHKNLFIILGEWWEQRAAHSRNQPAQESMGRVRRLLYWLTPNGGALILFALLIATQSVWAGSLQSTANAPGPSATTVNYQGRLANNGGTPLDGTFGMTFAIYDAPSAGNLIWGPESHAAVPVSSGLFNVGLGSQTAGGIPTSVWNGDRYLEIAVGGETLAPRELIRSVPIAGMALTVPDGAITTAKIADGAITQAKAPRFVYAPSDNARVAYGQTTVQRLAGSDFGGVAVSLASYGFTQPPIALCGMAGPGGFAWTCHVQNETKDGFTIWARWADNTGWTTTQVRWVAIGN